MRQPNRLNPSTRTRTRKPLYHNVFHAQRTSDFGTSSAAEVFQDAIQEVLSGIEGASNVSDDIIIFGTDQAAHDKARHAVFERYALRTLH